MSFQWRRMDQVGRYHFDQLNRPGAVCFQAGSPNQDYFIGFGRYLFDGDVFMRLHYQFRTTQFIPNKGEIVLRNRNLCHPQAGSDYELLSHLLTENLDEAIRHTRIVKVALFKKIEGERLVDRILNLANLVDYSFRNNLLPKVGFERLYEGWENQAKIYRKVTHTRLRRDKEEIRRDFWGLYA